MTLFEDSQIVCVYLYTYAPIGKAAAIDYTFDFATIVYREKDKEFNDLKKKKVLFKTENGLISDALIYMSYKMAEQFLSRLGFKAIYCDIADDSKYLIYREHWECIYSSRACSEFATPKKTGDIW